MTGTVVTFYSYKGGVGRTFALANTAATLCRWGYRTLCIGWDLDAPGGSQAEMSQTPACTCAATPSVPRLARLAVRARRGAARARRPLRSALTCRDR